MKYNLSEITELIRNRRTIYPEQYSSRNVQRDQIEMLLNNAIWVVIIFRLYIVPQFNSKPFNKFIL
jgi:hypothetical protein